MKLIRVFQICLFCLTISFIWFVVDEQSILSAVMLLLSALSTLTVIVYKIYQTWKYKSWDTWGKAWRNRKHRY